MNELLFELLQKGATVDTLKKELKLNNYQLTLKLNALKNKGYTIYRKNHYDFPTYHLAKSQVIKNTMYTPIFIQGGKVRFILISDTHLCHMGDRIDLIESIYDYAIKNDIKGIIHTGDLIEGVSEAVENHEQIVKIPDSLEQAKYVVKNYPKDNTITNYILLGNHDSTTLNYSGFDISQFIASKRLDMIFTGYRIANLKINNDFIALHHPFLQKNNHYYDEEINNDFVTKKNIPFVIIRGHTHASSLYDFEKSLVICVPALYDKGDMQKGAWDIELTFGNNGKICNLELHPLIVEPKITPVTKILRKVNR